MSAYGPMRYKGFQRRCTGALALIAALMASAMPLRAGNLYRSLQSLTCHLEPLPLRCAKEDTAYRGADDTLSFVYSLASPDDRLVLLMRDGSYTLFSIAEGHNLVPVMVNPPQAREVFESLTGISARVWVVCADALVGAAPQPPAQYAALLNSRYLLLSLPMPTYCGDFSASLVSTNHLLRQAALFESLSASNPGFVTQQFYIALGHIYRQVDSNAAALSTYRRGIGQFPESPAIHRAMADCYFVAFSNYPEAIEYNFKANQLHKRQFQGQPLYEAVFSTALAYERMGDLTKAQLQYNDILGTIDAFPDIEWESRTRHYLGDLYLRKGMTNEAVRQFQIDLDIAGVKSSYAFQRLLAMFDAPGSARSYADTARAYFQRCGTNDAYAIFAHIRTLDQGNDIIKLAEAVRTARTWMHTRPALVADLRKQTDWWALWTAVTARVGVPAEP